MDNKVLQYNLILQNRYTIKEKQLLVAKSDHRSISSMYEIHINIEFKYTIFNLFSKSDVIWKIEIVIHSMCVLGFEGDRCQSLVDHCVSGPCRNGATCSSSLDGPHCYCVEGTYL